MTAFATAYTSLGFAIAADGRQRWDHSPTRDVTIRRRESDTVQKIFKIVANQGALACIVRGHVANRDMTFDLSNELISQSASLQWRDFTGFNDYLHTLSTNTRYRIDSVLGSMLDGQYPAAEVAFVGYFRMKPHFAEVSFLPYVDPVGYRVTEFSMSPGSNIVSGSQVIEDLLSMCDPRVIQFCKHLDDGSTLEDAIGFVTSYVEACSSEVALKLDPTCEDIGGHIHVATVTPATGFRWIVQPVTSA
jgi:hypothetical protein